MKRLILIALILMTGKVYAGLPEWDYPPSSSYTAGATPGPIIFSSVPYRFLAIVVSSQATGSSVAFFRSTSATFLPTLATQTLVSTELSLNGPPVLYVPLYGMTNTSFTYINKIGEGKITIIGQCIGGVTRTSGNLQDTAKQCPGLNANGTK